MSTRNQTKIIPFILIGLLSLFGAEVFSGSSKMWFLNPWAIFVTFPLYLAHLLFYFNLAIRTGRTSIPQLYFWGVLFALYEGPITKVLWGGYGDAAPIWGTFAGVGLLEFPTLVFFWHPVMSFLLPLLLFQILARAANADPSNILPSTLPLLQKSKRTLMFFFGVAIMGSLLLSFNSQFDAGVAIATGLGSIVLILIAKKLAGKSISLQHLVLGRRGFTMVIVYLVVLYAVMWWVIFPEKQPGVESIVTITLTALVSGLILWRSRPRAEKSNALSMSQLITTRDIYKTWALFLALLLVWTLIPPQTTLAALVLQALPFAGIALFVVMVIRTFTERETKRLSFGESRGTRE
ncbi:MAG: hypothetical protein HY340_01830 [Candidatus Kerfeldbacteria bacterium]|nr:hypothetical protein [Candidatus Kerfeldbacteria bacterium]